MNLYDYIYQGYGFERQGFVIDIVKKILDGRIATAIVDDGVSLSTIDNPEYTRALQHFHDSYAVDFNLLRRIEVTGGEVMGIEDMRNERQLSAKAKAIAMQNVLNTARECEQANRVIYEEEIKKKEKDKKIKEENEARYKADKLRRDAEYKADKLIKDEECKADKLRRDANARRHQANNTPNLFDLLVMRDAITDKNKRISIINDVIRDKIVTYINTTRGDRLSIHHTVETQTKIMDKLVSMACGGDLDVLILRSVQINKNFEESIYDEFREYIKNRIDFIGNFATQYIEDNPRIKKIEQLFVVFTEAIEEDSKEKCDHETVFDLIVDIANKNIPEHLIGRIPDDVSNLLVEGKSKKPDEYGNGGVIIYRLKNGKERGFHIEDCFKVMREFDFARPKLDY